MVHALLKQARKEHSYLKLAMAFRIQKPEWGSQAVLVAANLVPFLNYIEWDLDNLLTKFTDWHDEQSSSSDKSLTSLEANSLKELVAMLNMPRIIELEADAVQLVTAGSRTTLMLEFINKGLVYHQVKDKLEGITIREYVNVLKKDDRDYHPNVIYTRMLSYIIKINQAATTVYKHNIIPTTNKQQESGSSTDIEEDGSFIRTPLLSKGLKA